MRRAMTNQELLRSKREVTGADVFEAVHVACEELDIDMPNNQFYDFVTITMMCLLDNELYEKVHIISDRVMRRAEESHKVAIKDVLE